MSGLSHDIQQTIERYVMGHVNNFKLPLCCACLTVNNPTFKRESVMKDRLQRTQLMGGIGLICYRYCQSFIT